MRIEISPGYWVDYIEGFFEVADADDLLRAFLAEEMTPDIVRMYGRDVTTKRRSAQYGTDYVYNARSKPSRAWNAPMQRVRARVESVAGPLDGGLVQVYPDGNAGIGWHRDKGTPEVIASLSLGAERELAFGAGPAARCREIWRMRLAHGSL